MALHPIRRFLRVCHNARSAEEEKSASLLCLRSALCADILYSFPRVQKLRKNAQFHIWRKPNSAGLRNVDYNPDYHHNIGSRGSIGAYALSKNGGPFARPLHRLRGNADNFASRN
jgi:hypothetical protein